MKDNKIAVVAAMKAECSGLDEILSKYNVVQTETGIGQINSVFALTNLLSKNEISTVINIGLAGSHSKEIHVGDVVVADRFLNANSYTTSPHALNDGIHFNEWTLVDWREGVAEKESHGLLSDRRLLTDFENYARRNNVLKFHIGNIWSGDIWNKEIDTINTIHSKYNTLCEDMESYAIKAVCDKFEVPMISIKIISNNELLNEPYNKSVVPILHNTVTNFVRFINNI